MEEKKSTLEIFAEKVITDAKDFITSEGKRAFIVYLRTEVIPALKAVVAPMLEECEKQGKTETGNSFHWDPLLSFIIYTAGWNLKNTSSV